MRLNIICYLVILFFKIRLFGAQQVPNTSSNQANSPSLVQPRFSDLSAMGFPNFGSRRFGNPTSNYPTHSFFPFGNQNNNIQRPHVGYGLGLQNQNLNRRNFQNRPIQEGHPTQQSYPDQGDIMNPSPNYQEPSYPDTPTDVTMYPNHNPNQGTFQNIPIQGSSPVEDDYPYQGDSMNRYPNYQEPTNSDQPNDVSMYPGYFNRPYQNGRTPSNQAGHYNWSVLRPGGMNQAFQYHPASQHNSLGNYQVNGIQNVGSDQINPDLPDDLTNLHNTNIQFPGSLYYQHPNQYYPQTSRPYQNPGSGRPDNFQSHPINNNPNNADPSDSYIPKQSIASRVGTVSGLSSSTQNAGNLNKIIQDQPASPKMKGINTDNAGDKEAISVKPVLVSSTTASPSGVVFNSTKISIKKMCVQDCLTTSEYNPMCGTNNVTYYNPMKFLCARKCGVVVYLRKTGRCDVDE